MTAAGPATPASNEPVQRLQAPLIPATMPPTAVPGPPPGPGVQPPFVAPPTEGARQRRWLALGLAGAAALVCCVGALFGLGGLVVLGSQVVEDEARGVVTDYLTAIRDEEFGQAYDLLCDREQRRASLSEFTSSFDDEPGLTSFTIGEVESAEQLVVTATLRYSNASTDQVRFLIEQDRQTAELEVCGQEG
jgi:hypothetical protein